MKQKQTAIFFDRDGIVNVRRIDDYVKGWDEFVFLPEIFGVLPEVHERGMLTVLITNQRGIARGMMSEATLAQIHAAMQKELERRTGARFDAIYHCPHDRDAGCNCRKPLPGMLLRAAEDLDIDLASSWMIGDSESDIEAGVAAGCHAILVGGGARETNADFTAPSLSDAWNELKEVFARSRPRSQ